MNSGKIYLYKREQKIERILARPAVIACSVVGVQSMIIMIIGADGMWLTCRRTGRCAVSFFVFLLIIIYHFIGDFLNLVLFCPRE